MDRRFVSKISAALWITPLAAGLIFATSARAQNSGGAAQILRGTDRKQRQGRQAMER